MGYGSRVGPTAIDFKVQHGSLRSQY
jgi:hypothetical protein